MDVSDVYDIVRAVLSLIIIHTFGQKITILVDCELAPQQIVGNRDIAEATGSIHASHLKFNVSSL